MNPHIIEYYTAVNNLGKSTVLLIWKNSNLPLLDTKKWYNRIYLYKKVCVTDTYSHTHMLEHGKHVSGKRDWRLDIEDEAVYCHCVSCSV